MLNTWDSCTCCSPRSTGKGLFDSFSISTSGVPYWNIQGLKGPLALFSMPPADPLSVLIPSPRQQHTCEVTSVTLNPQDTCPLDAGLLIGGPDHLGSTFSNSLAGTEVTLPSTFFFASFAPTNNTWLNFVLDTATAPDSDNLRPSWGEFHIYDLTPLCLDNRNLTGSSARGRLYGAMRAGSLRAASFRRVDHECAR